MGSTNAANVQGAGPLGTEGFPLGVTVNNPASAPATVQGTATAANAIAGTNTAPAVNTLAKTFRSSSIHHRIAIAATDLLAVPASPTGVDVPGGGSLNFSTAYNFTLAANSTFGPTSAPAVGSVTTAADAMANHAILITVAQVASSVAYDIFLSTAAAPLWVARVTEAQRAAGDTVTAVGVLSGVSPGAGKIQVNVVGTGVASTANPFANNNAYNVAGITPIDCTGALTAIVHVALSVTDLRLLPTLSYVVLLAPVNQPGVYYQLNPQGPAILTATRTPLKIILGLNVFGAAEMIVIVYGLSGQGAAVDVWVDLN